MEWTTVIPTVPGYYWAMRYGNLTLVRLDEITFPGYSTWHCFVIGSSYSIPREDFGHWFGPLPAPPVIDPPPNMP